MVRAAGLYGQVAAGVTALSVDDQSPSQQLNAINAFAAELVREKARLWQSLQKELSKAGIHLVEAEANSPMMSVNGSSSVSCRISSRS